MDMESNEDCPYLNWRLILESDFSDFLHSRSVQNQFLGNHIKYSVVCCQYFFAPAILPNGWVLYMWDMLSRSIHVLNHTAGAKGPNLERKECLEFVCAQLHEAFFNCSTEFLAGWPKQKENWSTIYPKIVDTKFSSVDSGISILHLLRYYDGARLKFPITKMNLAKTRRDALHELMKLCDNSSPLPADTFWVVLAPSQYSFGEFLTDVHD